MIRPAVALCALALLAGCGGGGSAAEGAGDGPAGALILATTTSVHDSGLLDEIVPDFEAASACTVKPLAVGSGEAMELGRRGDADVLIVHSPEDERAFMREAHGTDRRLVMRNDFVLVGPADDPAGIAQAPGVGAALQRIAAADAEFASRGDDSGTHAKELSLWQSAGLAPDWSGYIETGQGMGPTLQIAAQKQAYTLSDRGTFLATEGLDSRILYEGSGLANPYHVIEVRDAANAGCAQEFADWITAPDAQRAIGSFGTAEFGEPLFLPALATEG